MGRVVLVTGISRDLGRRFARSAAGDPAIDRVIGVDVVPPRGDIGDVSFVRADIRNPVIAKVLAKEDVDTVVHMSVIATPGSAGGRNTMKELNVIGTMQLLAACQKAPGVERLVVKSTTTVYGASSRDPAMFTEEMGPKRLPELGLRQGRLRGRGLRPRFRAAAPRRRGDDAPRRQRHRAARDSPITSYFRLPVVPRVLGFDPRLQFLHEDDLLDVLGTRARRAPGTFNVAGDGMLMLSQAVRRLGSPSVAAAGVAVGRLGSALRQARVADFSPEQLAFLTYGRGMDTTRMRAELGFEPRFTTAVGVRRLRAPSASRARRASRPRRVPSGVPVAESERRHEWPTSSRSDVGSSRSRHRQAASLAAARTWRRAAASPPAEPRVSRPPEPAPAPATSGRGRRAVAATRPAATTEERHPLAGIPVGDWLARLPARGRGAVRRAVGAAAGRAPGLPAPPAHRRLHRRRVRLRPRDHRAVLHGGAAPDRPEVVPRRGPRRRQHPGHRRCPGGVQPLGHGPGGRPDDESPSTTTTGRFLRPLGADLVFKLPVVSTLARKSGATLACSEDAERMLAGGELVGVWPEGFKGIGKPFGERYKLQRFGRGGFVSAALRTGVPIVPLSVVGAEEIYPMVGNLPVLARLLGVPYIPITPLFPLLGPLGMVPLPSKWLIEFGEPIRTDEYDAGEAEDPMLVFDVTDQVRETIQQTLYTLLRERQSVFR